MDVKGNGADEIGFQNCLGRGNVMCRNKMENHLKWAKMWNRIILSVFLIMIIVSLSSCGIYKYRHTFTIEKWNRESENRRKIVNDLLKKHDIFGMTEKEIICLLGEEEAYANTKTSFKMSRIYFEPENTLVYYLGVDYMDDMWLVISLDDGVVSSYCIDIT